MAFLVLGVVHSFFFGWVGSGWFSWEAAYGVRFLFRLFPVAGLFRGAGLRDRRRSAVTLHGRNPAGRMAGLFLVHGFAKRGGAPSSMGMVPGPLSGPWTRGGRHRRPRMGFRVDHVFGPCLVHGPGRWFAGPSSHGPSRVGHVFGPPNGPWSVRVSTMTVRPYMVLRVGRMIGPACGPLVHSHDVDRKRAGHVGGPPASTWSIWPLVQGPGLRPWPTRRGLIVDRAVLDGPWSWLTPSSASDRPVRPTADTRRLRQDLFILRVAPR